MQTRNPLAILVGLAAVAFMQPAAAQTVNFEAFNAACLEGEAFLIGGAYTGEAADLVMAPACSCLVTGLGEASQADIDMLTTDLNGTATDESHAAYATYGSLQETAGNVLRACFEAPEVVAAMQAADALGTETQIEPVDVSEADALAGVTIVQQACVASEGIMAQLQASPKGGEAARTEMCGCIATALQGRITLEDANMLGRELAGTLSSEERAAYPRGSQLGLLTESSWESCAASTGSIITD